VERGEMVVIGIVGGVASGKSAVARMFESLGAVRLDADHAGHLVLRQPDVRELLVARWGETILDAAGHVDRSRVAIIVFDTRPQGADELQFLESVTHPRIREELQRQLDAAAAAGAPAAVLDAALLLEAGWDELCDHRVFVEVPCTERLRRARQRGWSTAEWEARESAQWPLEEKRRRCDTIIDNSGSLEETLDQVKAVWSTWKVDRD
jgi:dephospho-CoA kinase